MSALRASPTSSMSVYPTSAQPAECRANIKCPETNSGGVEVFLLPFQGNNTYLRTQNRRTLPYAITNAPSAQNPGNNYTEIFSVCDPNY
jgi:hypothetical protein